MVQHLRDGNINESFYSRHQTGLSTEMAPFFQHRMTDTLLSSVEIGSSEPLRIDL
jgi:hypothetical protein